MRDGFVCGFTNAGPNYHFIGVQVVDAAVFAGVPDDRPSNSVGSLYPSLIKARSNAIGAFVCRASFDDIGTPAGYLATSLRVASDEGRGDALHGADCSIHPTARVTRSVLWDRVQVGDGASLDECVVSDDVAIPAGARFERQAIVRGGGTGLDHRRR